MTIAYQDIGAAVGPLRHIFIGADGSFQVDHGASDSYQVAPVTSALGDGGTFLSSEDTYLQFSPRFEEHDDSNWGTLLAERWDMHSQSVVATVDGVSRVITQLQTLGDDITITQVDTYVHGQDCWRTDMILQNDYNTALTVRLYRVLDTQLNGSAGGCGVTRAGGAVGVAENEGNVPAGPVLWLIPLVSGQFFEGDVLDLAVFLENQVALSNTVVSGITTDAGIGVAWDLMIPAKSVVVRSCLTQVAIPQPVLPPTVDAWHFRGFCYRGADGDTGTPLGGVTLKLYVGSTSTFGSATLKRTTVSDAAGFWNFYEDQSYTYYWVQAVVPAGMTETGSATGDGTVISETLLRWGSSPARGVHAGNRFFMV